MLSSKGKYIYFSILAFISGAYFSFISNLPISNFSQWEMLVISLQTIILVYLIRANRVEKDIPGEHLSERFRK